MHNPRRARHQKGRGGPVDRFSRALSLALPVKRDIEKHIDTDTNIAIYGLGFTHFYAEPHLEFDLCSDRPAISKWVGSFPDFRSRLLPELLS